MGKILNSKDIHKEMFPVYIGECLSRKAVHNWTKKFSQGRLKVADDARQVRPVEIVTGATVQLVEELIRVRCSRYQLDMSLDGTPRAVGTESQAQQ
jgi:hypothetical protein